MNPEIIIENANENNLKNVSVKIPHYKLTVVTGVSGSGKSSLVYDVICREGQRLFLENFLAGSQQAGKKLRKPHVNKIKGLFPIISVNQQNSVRNPRSTVGTLTELYDYLRLLFARLGKTEVENLKINRSLFSFNLPQGQCPICKGLGVEDRIDPDLIISDSTKTLRQGCMVLSTPNGYIIYSQVTIDVLNDVCNAEGFNVDIPWNELTDYQKNIIWNGTEKIKIPFGKHTLESRMKWTGITAKPREEGFYKGILPVMEEILKRDRNPNILRFVKSVNCNKCNGKRLSDQSLSVYLWGKSISDFTEYNINQIFEYFTNLKVSVQEKEIVDPVRELILNRSKILMNLGLGYLSLDRESTTLSGGEYQRIRLGNQAATGLRNVLYVLDEPSAGLHPADHQRLMKVIKSLVENKNTVIVVEHDRQTMLEADYIIDIGPGSGEAGGEILFSGSLEEFLKSDLPNSRTHNFLINKEEFIYSHTEQRPASNVMVSGVEPLSGRSIVTKINAFGIPNAIKHNLKNITVEFKANCFNVITGVSGSGKSSLIDELIEKSVANKTNGTEIFKRVIHLDQSPIGRTPKSNPATYTGMSDYIRDLFAALPESQKRDYKKGQFSFVVKGGRCEACEGAGVQEVGMHFLGNVEVVCEECDGKRFHKETLEIKYKDKNIYEVLELSIKEAHEFFEKENKITQYTQVLLDLGLGYIKLGQSSNTLSGGEAQRVKLATELAKTSTGKILYILDEPTTGLHLADIKVLLLALQKLIEKGNTVLSIEHHPDFILSSDHVIDLGPGSGENGGQLLFSGTPKELIDCTNSITGIELKKHIANDGEKLSCFSQKNETYVHSSFKEEIELNGITTHNLKNLKLAFRLNSITTVCGVSGSGKSSLVFDTLNAESQRRFNDSLSSYIRQFIGKTGNAEVVSAFGLTPSVSIEKKRVSSNPRSTVGTFTGIYDLLRLLYSRAGKYPEGVNQLLASSFSFNNESGACQDCKGMGYVTTCDPDKLVSNKELSLINGAMNGSKTGKFYGDPFGQYVAALITVGKSLGIDYDKPWQLLSEGEKNIAMYGHSGMFDVDWNYKRGNVEGTHNFKTEWKGFVNLVNDEYFRKHEDGRGEAMLSLMRHEKCPVCNGKRLNQESLSVTVAGMDISEFSALPIEECYYLLNDNKFLINFKTQQQSSITLTISKEIIALLEPLLNVGLGYISIDRILSGLSGGEFQRLQLAAGLSSGLTGITYLIDEPSFGLHSNDLSKIKSVITGIKDAGNTVVMVEQSEELISISDYVIELGPEGGKKGGSIIAKGVPDRVLSQRKKSEVLPFNFSLTKGIIIEKAFANNLKEINLEIPEGGFVVISGVSGSGKTSLLNDVIYESYLAEKPVNCKNISGFNKFEQIVSVEQEMPFQSALSIPATYLEIFDIIRDTFAKSKEGVTKSYKLSHFSYHTKDGQCPNCLGAGSISVSLDYFTDAKVPCEICNGFRYNSEVLLIKIDGFSIGDLLNISFSELKLFFEKNLAEKNKAKFNSILQLIEQIGLGYLTLGQPLNTLSTGEMQRLKLVKAISESLKSKTLYLLDEPTGGLHAYDIEKLINLFQQIIKKGSSIICVSHEPLLLKCADWHIETGPGAGAKGGEIVYSGRVSLSKY
ncbi:MAG: ATP-binding cassette domain-containing protein [Bacteroidia bacterium]|nr:ATP-binding cassette domain-containing protein [Bacteroidia bacterium]